MNSISYMCAVGSYIQLVRHKPLGFIRPFCQTNWIAKPPLSDQQVYKAISLKSIGLIVRSIFIWSCIRHSHKVCALQVHLVHVEHALSVREYLNTYYC